MMVTVKCLGVKRVKTWGEVETKWTLGYLSQKYSKRCISLNLCPGSQSICWMHMCSAQIFTKLIGQ